ncbi:MAG: TonB-dependent receptor [Bacteroidota bacterium]
MNRVLLLMTVILCIGLLPTHAQTGTISGFVKDADNNPLPGINVAIEGTSFGGFTDKSGAYSIPDLPAGRYNVVASSIGFETKMREVLLVAGQVLNLDFETSEVALELQSVEIMGRKSVSYDNRESFGATKTATLIKDTPQAISYVTKEVMEDRQAYRVNDVVKNISGINQFSYYNDYTIRGFRSQQELINGLRVIGLFGPQILTANLERVEVIKGPAAAVAGNGSPGGTMNRVTKKPLDEDRKAINFTTGSFNTFRSTLDFTGPLNEDKTLLYRLNIGYENSNDFRDLQEFRSLMVAPSITFLPTDKTRINFDLVVTNFDGLLDRGQPIFGAAAGTDLNSTPISFAIGAANDYHETNVGFSTLSLSHDFTKNFSFNASYMRYTFSEDLFEHRTSNRFAVDAEGEQIPTLMGMRISAREQKQISDNVTSYFIWDIETGPFKHKILAGYDYVQSVRPVGGGSIFTSSSAIYRTTDDGLANYDPDTPERFIFENGAPKPNIPHFNLADPSYTLGYPSDYILGRGELPATKFFSHGIYIQDQIKWNKLQVLLGLRQEYYTEFVDYKQPGEESRDQQAFIPRLGLVYTLSPAINIYGSYTESFQPQQAANLVESRGGPFDPTLGKMLEVGAKGTFFNNRLSVNAALYDIENQNILINNPETGLLEQRGAEGARGFELDINGRIGRNLSLTANYAYNNATIEEDDNELVIGERKENAPLHSGGFFFNYAFEGYFSGLNFNLGANFVTERNTFDTFRAGELVLPGYTVFDAGVAYKVNKVRVALTLNNLFDETHWVGGYSFVRLFPGAPRNFLLSIGYTF